MNDSIRAFVESIDFARTGGLVPTVVCTANDPMPRMLAYSTPASLEAGIAGESGDILEPHARSALAQRRNVGKHAALDRCLCRLRSRRAGLRGRADGPGLSPRQRRMFTTDPAFTWATLVARVAARAAGGEGRSYTRQLLGDPALLAAKLSEEAAELAEARAREDVAWECADLLYFITVKMQHAGIGIGEVMAQLQRRAT